MEILLAYLSKVTFVATLITFISAIGWFTGLCSYMGEKRELSCHTKGYPWESKESAAKAKEGMDFWGKITKKTFIVFICFLPISLTPSVEDLWKMRLSLLKYELASPENVKKSTDEIARIAHKLECKYLGCEEKR